MSVTVKVEVDPDFVDELGKVPAEVVEAGSMAVYEFLKAYHGRMDWKGPHWFSGANSGQFARDVVEGWQKPQVSGLSATIENKFGLLSWKISGGTITPRAASRLTIPLISQAKGVRAREFPDKLFRAGSALCRDIGRKLEAVYALKESVTQKPWPHAMPTDEALSAAFMEGVQKLP